VILDDAESLAFPISCFFSALRCPRIRKRLKCVPWVEFEVALLKIIAIREILGGFVLHKSLSCDTYRVQLWPGSSDSWICFPGRVG
jgi:hypothetical protein